MALTPNYGALILIFFVIPEIIVALRGWGDMTQANAGRDTWRSSNRIPLALAGAGFGAAEKGSRSNRKKTKPRTTRNILETGGGGEQRGATFAPRDQTEKTPLLDKWGLPPPTEEDIFPQMPAGTELRSAQNKDYQLDEIIHFLRDHMKMHLDRFFDQNGIQRRAPTDGAPPMKLRLLHESPPILAIENFFTPEQCRDVENVAIPANETEGPTGTTVQVNSKTFALAQSIRTSTSWFCHYKDVPVLIAKAHHVLSIPLEHMEEPQIVRYQSGQQFSWHYDEIPPAQRPNGGQRLATLLVYLNTVPKGGGTVFRDLKDADGNQPLCVQPEQGLAVLFFPAYSDGRPDDRTLHKGEKVLDTEKRIIQMWIHERTYQAVLPSGNFQSRAQPIVEEVSRELGLITETPTGQVGS